MLSEEQVELNAMRIDRLQDQVVAADARAVPVPRWVVRDIFLVARNFRADRAALAAEVERLKRADREYLARHEHCRGDYAVALDAWEVEIDLRRKAEAELARLRAAVAALAGACVATADEIAREGTKLELVHGLRYEAACLRDIAGRLDAALAAAGESNHPVVVVRQENRFGQYERLAIYVGGRKAAEWGGAGIGRCCDTLEAVGVNFGDRRLRHNDWDRDADFPEDLDVLAAAEPRPAGDATEADGGGA